jgi:hypothetical protein
VLLDQVDASVSDHFERGECRPEPGLRQLQQLHRRGRRGHRDEGHRLGGRHREQLQCGAGDDAQGAFAADEQVAQVVAGVVLAQAAQPVPHLTLDGHHFQAQAEFARVAVAQHLHATGVGGQVAADGAAALRRQAQREQPAGVTRGLLHLQQREPRVGNQGVVQRIDAAQAVHAPQREHQRITPLIGGAAARQAGVAALRHHGYAVRVAPAQHGRHVGGAVGLGHGDGTPGPLAAPVGQEGGHVGRLGVQSPGEGAAQGLEVHGARAGLQ